SNVCFAAAKRALYFDVSAFGERGSEVSELAENQNAMPLGARFPFVRLFVLPALFFRQAEHGEIRAVVLSGFHFSVFSEEKVMAGRPRPPSRMKMRSCVIHNGHAKQTRIGIGNGGFEPRRAKLI